MSNIWRHAPRHLLEALARTVSETPIDQTTAAVRDAFGAVKEALPLLRTRAQINAEILRCVYAWDGGPLLNRLNELRAEEASDV